MEKTPSAKLASRGPVPKRIAEVDFLRGFSLFLMFLDHLCYDLSYWPAALQSVCKNYFAINSPFVEQASLFGYQIFYTTEWRMILHCIFAGIFMFICGVSCALSHNNQKRTFGLGIVALLLNLGFYAAAVNLNDESLYVYIGILNALFIGLLAYDLVDFFFKSWKADLLAGSLFLVFTCVFVSPNPVFYYDYQEVWRHFGDLFLGRAAAGADYARPLAAITLVFLGAGVGKLLYGKEKKSYLPWLSHLEPFPFLGRHSLGSYLLHQPILFAILALISLCLGYRI